MSDANLTLAAQTGVDCITLRYLGEKRASWSQAVEQIRALGMEPAAVEGYVPMNAIIYGTEYRDREIDVIQDLLETMHSLRIPILCYNFMAGTDWVRTSTKALERGGARTSRFRLADVQDAVMLNYELRSDAREDTPSLTSDALWDNLAYFLERIIPKAEQLGIALAMHPDDPPMDNFLGRPRIMNSVESFDRLLSLATSASNGICFCQATFAAMGNDVIETIRHFGSAIKFVHFRDVRGSKTDFTETFHDNGPTNMPAAMRAYRDICFDGPIRPDHVPQLHGEEEGEPGYTMLGRLFAFGYIRGLIQATGEST